MCTITVLFFLQDKDEHLELLDGTLVDLLNAKWNTFVKDRSVIKSSYIFQREKYILIFSMILIDFINNFIYSVSTSFYL